jgi:UDP-N-acetylmuramoylalanine--D-glutamate ligase
MTPEVPSATARSPDHLDRALVVGLGRSGLAAAEVLVASGVSVLVVDDRAQHPGADAARSLGAEVVLDRPAAELVGGVDLVVPSPGVPERAPVLVQAAMSGVPVWSEPELGYRLHPRRLLAVTGTNGKTSTVELLTAMLDAAGWDAVACGNIGTPFTTAAAAAGPDAVLVAELSSFQLRFAGHLRPEVGVLLNLAADHLDWHGDLDAYADAKGRLWEAQGAGDWAVANLDDPVTIALRDRLAPGGRAAFSASRVPEGVGVGVGDGRLVAATPAAEGPILDLDELPLQAPHHVANVAAAASAALLAGVPRAAVAEATRRFRPGRHRLELVADAGGVRWVNDSKATNVHAAAAALGSAGSILWLAGGLAKGVELAALAPSLGAVRTAVLFGTAAGELAAVCAGAGVPSRTVTTLEEAVEVAAGLAEAGDTVLLAPACASFDQFRDYADRGDRFAAAVLEVVGAAAAGTTGGSDGAA